MLEIKFRAWHKKDKKLYYRAYQKVSHVLLCDQDHGQNDGKGTPVKRAGYDDCIFFQNSTILDKNGFEIFEGDIVRIKHEKKMFEGTLESIPDMFKSRRLHPLYDLLVKFGLTGKEEDLEFEIVGNIYSSLTGKFATSAKS